MNTYVFKLEFDYQDGVGPQSMCGIMYAEDYNDAMQKVVAEYDGDYFISCWIGYVCEYCYREIPEDIMWKLFNQEIET